jgi:Dyp-type peroxidase family
MTRHQRGIFYRRKSRILHGGSNSSYNSTFAVLFLKAAAGSSVKEIGKSLKSLWNMYTSLRTGQISVAIGYGPRIFRSNEVKKEIPENLNKQFLPPSNENRYLLDGCTVKYSDETDDNIGTNEDILIQIISNTQLATYNAIADTSKYCSLADNGSMLKFSRFYTGFERSDGRSWLGFHDEVSNLSNERDRRKAIFVDPVSNDLRLKDYWTKGGTYLAFIRMEIDLLRWEQIDAMEQELIVGRRKKDSMPLIGVDKKGRPLAVDRFKPRTTTRMIRDHPDYLRIKLLPSKILNKLDLDESVRILTQSHVGRTRHMDGIGSDKISSRRIYRQSFEFIEPLYGSEKPVRLGLNFISFQNDPSRLFFILTDPNWMGGSNFGGESGKSGILDLLSVLAAGVFYIPPIEKPFPGASIFI